MDSFVIEGEKRLAGQVEISGAKNAILPIMTATLLAKGKFVLHNVPRLNDIKMMSHLLRIIGAKVDFQNGTLIIDTQHCSYHEAPYELVSKMRASINVLGPLLARFGEARVSLPGGCAIGTRPVDLHIRAMQALGAKIEVEHGYIVAQSRELRAATIDFDKVSVGATENALCAAVLAKGKTLIRNAAQEPEVDALIEFLTSMGAKIHKGCNKIYIEGVEKLHPTEMTMIPDRIEAGTFLLAGAITKSKITVANCIPDHLAALIQAMELSGCQFELKDDKITIIPSEKIVPTNIITKPYPGFPTDLQAQFMAYMTICNGEASINETIFPERFMHVAELNRLDANITVQKNIATIKGVKKLSGAPVMATDLRASAALVLAGLAAEGKTNISRIYHIDRGYDRIEEKLNQLGGKIKRVFT